MSPCYCPICNLLFNFPQLNQKKEEVEQKKNEYNFKMRQLECISGGISDFVNDESWKLLRLTLQKKIVTNTFSVFFVFDGKVPVFYLFYLDKN